MASGVRAEPAGRSASRLVPGFRSPGTVARLRRLPYYAAYLARGYVAGWLRRLRETPDPAGRRVIVTIRHKPNLRMYKIARVLRSTGRYHTVLLTRYPDPMMMPESFHEVHLYRTSRGALRILRRLRVRYGVDLLDLYGQPSRTARFLLESDLGIPTIYQNYDAALLQYGPDADHSDIPDERFCYANADGVLFREEEGELLREWLGPIGCWMDLSEGCVDPIPPRPATGKEIHIAYAGMIFPEGYPSEAYSHGKFLWLARHCHDQGIHLHLYPNPLLYYACPEYRRMRSPYVHWHKSLPYPDLIRDLSRYDFGSLLMRNHPTNNRYSTREKEELGGSNKPYTYLDAGLPILLYRSAWRGITEYGAGIHVPVGEVSRLRSILESVDREALREGVRRAQEVHALRRRMGDLETFFDRVREAHARRKAPGA